MSKHTSKLVMPAAIGSAHAGNHRPRSVMNFTIHLAVLGALAGSIGAAQAALVLPAASSFVDCMATDGHSVSATNSCAISGAAASVTRGPAVELTASSSHNAGFDVGANGFATFTYSFAVLGGTLDTVVPVNIDFALQATSTNGVSLADIVANTPQSAKEAEICSEATCSLISTNLAGTLHVSVFAGEANGNTISLRIQAGEEGSVDIASATAYATSWLYVDPTFANAGAYSIVLSDGVGNGMAAAVPEPETYALMLGGLGSLAWVARRRRAAR